VNVRRRRAAGTLDVGCMRQKSMEEFDGQESHQEIGEEGGQEISQDVRQDTRQKIREKGGAQIGSPKTGEEGGE
jgi:hypothetical protein